MDGLAARFRLSGRQIGSAVRAAAQRAIADGAVANLPALYAAARAESGDGLNSQVRRLRPRFGWDDIVLPPERLAQLREICDAVKFLPVVYEQWGFERKVPFGPGLNILFAGPPGTGKTMAAEVIAMDLEMDLYSIDLSVIVSKYIGETEKNLAQAFTEASKTNAILFFDEADALFGRRSEVRDSHDRYANIEVGYLLHRMEDHDGITILATNLRRNMDEAFVRRMHYTVDFPLPGVAERREIWNRVWPDDAPRDPTVDFGVVAASVELPGGSIRNIALAAALRAAAGGGPVTLDHLAAAVRRELQKVGKIVKDVDFEAFR
jgi:SpoVK/Ycf46/Vps4 family AAA+-type ATPase